VNWSSTDGVTFDDPTVANPLATVPGFGTFGITLNVTCGDDDPVQCSSTVDLIEQTEGCKLPPVADAGGPYTVDEGGSIPLDGSASTDPDGGPITYEWDFDYDDITFDVDASGSSTPTFSAAGLDGPSAVTVAVRVTNDENESDIDDAEVTVNNVAPVIGSVTGDIIDEDGTATVSGTFSDVGTTDSFTVTIDWGEGAPEDFVYAVGSTGFSETHQYLDDNPSGTASDNYDITVTVTDDDGGSASDSSADVVVNNIAPVVGVITVDSDLVPVGAEITASASFTDTGTQDTHDAAWDWGDGSSSGTVTQGSGSGSVENTHTYTDAGVYTIELTVTDDDTGSHSVIYQYVVVYDPSAGFVTGGGLINSPAGAYIPDLTLTGTANFGFVSKYKKSKSTPEGSTEFQFQAGDINFHSNTYEWLVIAGHKAMYKGVGTINGAGNFGFLLKAIDEKLTPSIDVDRFNIKIWDKDNGDAIVYDNSLGTADDAEANQDISQGQIVIHSKK
jgi:PKD repeat protein